MITDTSRSSDSQIVEGSIPDDISWDHEDNHVATQGSTVSSNKPDDVSTHKGKGANKDAQKSSEALSRDSATKSGDVLPATGDSGYMFRFVLIGIALVIIVGLYLLRKYWFNDDVNSLDEFYENDDEWDNDDMDDYL